MAAKRKITRKRLRKRKYTKPANNPSWFKEGNDFGNRFGRPRLTPEQAKDSALFREACRERSPRALEILEELAEHADRDSVRVNSTEIILAYGHGRPTQHNTLSGPNGGPIPTQNLPLTKEQLKDELARRGLPTDILTGE